MKRYIVTLGNSTTLEVYRTWLDWIWFDNPLSGFVRFRLKDSGNIIKVSKHFTLSIEEIK